MIDVSEESKLKLRVQRTVSMGGSSQSMDTPTNETTINDGIQKELQRHSDIVSHLLSTFGCVVFGLLSWHYPRYLIAADNKIWLKPAPYQLTAAGDVILDFELNHKVSDPPIIPSELLKWSGCYIPFIITVTHAFLTSRKISVSSMVVHLCLVISSFSVAMGLSEGTTQLLKLWIQRPRPSYYDICGFDKILLKCTAPLENIKEANFSFPSGHSSLSACGTTFVVWYFLGNMKLRSRLMTTLVVVIPWGWAIFVAGSRLVDKWHHPSDVVAGLALGFSASTIAYHLWFPPVWLPSEATLPHIDERAINGNTKLASSHE